MLTYADGCRDVEVGTLVEVANMMLDRDGSPGARYEQFRLVSRQSAD
jgi:hypothetical protein